MIFTGFAVLGTSAQSDLKTTCAPFCTETDLAPIKRDFLIADIALAAGVASLGAAAYFYLTRERSTKTAAAPFVSVETATGGASFGARGQF